MKILLTLWIGILLLTFGEYSHYAQDQLPSKGLGSSDADWKILYGIPKPYQRDVWIYENGRYFTRSWYRKDAPAGWEYPGYISENYYVKYIEIVWGRRNPVPFITAKAEVKKIIPVDSRFYARRYGPNLSEFYSSLYLAKRIFPLTAGDRDCVTPWGFGLGKFRVKYIFHKSRIIRAIVDVGEPHETAFEACNIKSPNI